jgi:nicotinate dehydrogenase subunit B
MTGPPSRPALPEHLAANPILSQWFQVARDGTIGLRVGKVELGQGIVTALAQLAAEELGVGLGQLRTLPANTELGPDEGVTAGSLSVSQAGPAVQAAAANVRMRFVAEAARRWQVSGEVIEVSDGVLTAAGVNASTTYGELSAAVDLDVSADPSAPLRPASDSRVAGTSAQRLDLPDKVAGRPSFVHDLRPAGLLFGRVVRPPSPGARLLDVAGDPARELGVQVVRDGSFVAALSPDEALALRAVASLRSACVWAEQVGLPDEDHLDHHLRTGPHETIDVVDEGPPGGGAHAVTATYSRPFLAHASIAPSCAVAHWADDRLTVWTHSQGIGPLRGALAEVLGLAPDRVVVEHREGAGCYGHNAADDAALDAALLARAVRGRPVQVMWSRADELGWAPFGSAMCADVSATLEDGRITSWTYDVWSQGHMGRPGFAGVPGLLAATSLERPWSYPAAVDPPAARGAGSTRNALPIYDLPHRRVTGHRLLHTPIRTSSLRSLGAFLNVFAIESFLDELALSAGRDPLDFRLDHLSDPRGRHVLETVASVSGWGTAMSENVGRGIGFARYKGNGAYCAVVAEVSATDSIRVHRLTVAVDVGRIVNPDGVVNQIEGGATQATSWTLKEQVRFDRRRVTSVDWESYPILTFAEAPVIDTHLVPSSHPSVGSGEAAQGPTAAAIANAVAAAIGVRVRDLPLTTDAVIAAIDAGDARS